eukprot:SAG31_NODE_1417_length_8440_cov_7.706510_3_plen_105_part_00
MKRHSTTYDTTMNPVLNDSHTVHTMARRKTRGRIADLVHQVYILPTLQNICRERMVDTLLYIADLVHSHVIGTTSSTSLPTFNQAGSMSTGDGALPHSPKAALS